MKLREWALMDEHWDRDFGYSAMQRYNHLGDAGSCGRPWIWGPGR